MRDPRWNSGSVYVFVIDATEGGILFSGAPPAASFQFSGRISDLFDGRDMVSVGVAFGEAYLYHDFESPATNQVESKVTFTKMVLADGVPLLVGSGIYPSASR